MSRFGIPERPLLLLLTLIFSCPIWIKASQEPQEEYLELTDLCFGEGGFVAVGSPGLIYLSPDGESWFKVRDEPKLILNSVTYARGRYWAVGLKNVTEVPTFPIVSEIGDTALLSSEDGAHWEHLAFPSTTWLIDIVHGDPGFIVLSQGDYQQSHRDAWFSKEGTNWQKLSFTRDALYSAVWGGGQFMVASIPQLDGDYVTSRSVTVWTSSDGVSWTSYTPERTASSARLFHAGDEFFLAADGLFRSRDGLLWKPVVEGGEFRPFDRTYVSGLYMQGGLYTSFASRDGLDWTPLDVGNYSNYLNPRSLTFGQNKWAALFGGVVTSVDGAKWTQRLSIPGRRTTATKEAPILRRDLQEVRKVAGRSITLEADAVGGEPLSYEWLKGSSPIGGATNSYLYLPTLNPGDAGDYQVIVRNSFGSVTSSWSQITIAEGQAPRLMSNQTDYSAVDGERILIRAEATGTPELRYQWYHNNQPLPQLQSTTLFIPSFAVTNEGVYYCEITNQWGMTKSEPFKISRREPIFSTGFSRADADLAPQDWRSITFGNGKFVAVGGEGESLVSSNSFDWYPGTIESIGSPTAVAFDGTNFLATTVSGEIFRSTDGFLWNREFQAPSALSCLAISPDAVVAGGPRGTVAVLKSGVWLAQKTGGDEHLNAIAWTGDRFLAAASPGILLSSTNGSDWVRQEIARDIAWRTLVLGSSNVFALGTGNEFNGATATFTAGSWGGPGPLCCAADMWPNAALAWNERVVAIGSDWSGGAVFSPSGDQWRANRLGGTSPLRSIAANDRVAVAVGERGTIVASTDLETWERRDQFWPRVRNMLFDGRQFVGLDEGTMILSTNGLNWSIRPSRHPSGVWSFEVKDGTYVIAANAGIYHSRDLIDWTLAIASPTGFNNLVRSGDLFVATQSGSPGSIYTSTTGYDSWQRRSHLPDYLFVQPFTTSDGRFWVGGNNGFLARSSDGTNWTSVPVNPAISFRSFCYANGIYLAWGSSSDPRYVEGLFRSDDATNWHAVNFKGSPQSSLSVQAAGDLFLASSSDGDLFCSRDGVHWDLSFHAPNGPFFQVTASETDLVIFGFTQRLFHANRKAAPRFALLESNLANGNPRLRLRTGSAQEAKLESSPQVNGPWVERTDLKLTDGISEWIAPPVTADPQIFYRAVITE